MKKLVLIGMLALLSACTGIPSHFEKPQVNLAGLQIAELGLIEQKFIVSLRVTNPNDINVPINGLNLKLDVNGQPFATGVSNEKVTLAKLGDTMIKVNVTTNLSNIWKQVKSLNKPLSYSLSGKLLLPLVPGGLSFDRKGELPSLGEFLPNELKVM
nr:LEA type 2 family protein [uncultured Deefgea sp.]